MIANESAIRQPAQYSLRCFGEKNVIYLFITHYQCNKEIYYMVFGIVRL